MERALPLRGFLGDTDPRGKGLRTATEGNEGVGERGPGFGRGAFSRFLGFKDSFLSGVHSEPSLAYPG